MRMKRAVNKMENEKQQRNRDKAGSLFCVVTSVRAGVSGPTATGNEKGASLQTTRTWTGSPG